MSLIFSEIENVYYTLCTACKNGEIDIVNQIFKNVNISELLLGTALYWASQGGHIDVMEFLLGKGANIDFIGPYGTALMRACCRSKINAVDYLLTAGANVNIKTGDGRTALSETCEIYDNDDGNINGKIFDRLIINGAKVDNDDIISLFIKTVRSGYAEIVEKLINIGVDINYQDDTGKTPLMQSILHANLKNIMILTNAGCNTKIVDNDGKTVFDHVKTNSEDLFYGLIYDGLTPEELRNVLDILLSLGLNINLQFDKNGETPLMRAADAGAIDLIYLLLEKGADINILDHDGNTVLIRTVENQDLEITRILLNHGAKFKIADLNYIDPENYEMRQLLEKYASEVC